MKSNKSSKAPVKAPAKAPWKMPDWMEPYRGLINNTGGNSVEELVNDDGRNSNVIVNAPRALICVAVKSQVGLLTALHKDGHLNLEHGKAKLEAARTETGGH